MNKLILAMICMSSACGKYIEIRDGEISNCCECLIEKRIAIEAGLPKTDDNLQPCLLDGRVRDEAKQERVSEDQCIATLQAGDEIRYVQGCREDACREPCWFLPTNQDGGAQ